MKDTYLCKCTMCDSILIDENPQVDAPLYDLKDYPKVMEMQRVSEVIGNPETEYWACPVCLTDGYLTDNIMGDIEEIVAQEVETGIETILIRVHNKLGTKSGDIPPEQQLVLDNIKGKLSELISHLVEQNL